MKVDFFLDPFFLSALALSVVSVISFERGRIRLSLVLLFIGSLFAGLFIATADPFIHIWDEQFHALVAKNMREAPLRPVLIEEPLFGYDPFNWTYTTIWMHKQPLFLWQMALSLKLFGLNALAVRLPSVLMHALLVFFIFRVGKLIRSAELGYYSALLFSFAYFPLEYISGHYATDHNDIAFMFYCFLSIWALTEYDTSPDKKVFPVLIGLFSGCAILCKWLPGLLVYGVWFLLILYDRRSKPVTQHLLPFLGSLLVCLLTFVPWQIYCRLNFPFEYKQAMDFNFRHITEGLDGHGGDHLFYYEALYQQFGEGLLIPPLVILSFIFTLLYIRRGQHKLILLTSILTPTLFFTFVKTKMYGYNFIIVPLLIICLTLFCQAGVEKLVKKIRHGSAKRWVYILFMLVLVFLCFDASRLYKHHSFKENLESRQIKIRETEMFETLKGLCTDGKYAIFNCSTSLNSYVLSIFYTGCPSFKFIPSEAEIRYVRSLGYKILAIDTGDLPEYILQDRAIQKFSFSLNR